MRILASLVLPVMTVLQMTGSADAQIADALRSCQADNTPADQKIVACSSVITDAPPREPQALAGIYLSRGNAYLGKRQFDQAVADFDQVIKLNPGSTDGYFGRGLAFQAQATTADDTSLNEGSFAARAVAAYTKVLELRPQSAGAASNRGQIYLRARRYDLAIADFSQAMQINPNNPTFVTNRALAYKASQKNDLAIADYRKALTLNVDADARRRIETALSELTNIKSGEAAAPDRPAPDTPEQRICLADGSTVAQKIAACSSVVATIPASQAQLLATIYISRGNAYREKEDYGHALPDFDAATKLDPTNPGSFTGRGFVLLQQKHFDQAIAEFDQVIKLKPSDAVSLGSIEALPTGKKGGLTARCRTTIAPLRSIPARPMPIRVEPRHSRKRKDTTSTPSSMKAFSKIAPLRTTPSSRNSRPKTRGRTICARMPI